MLSNEDVISVRRINDSFTKLIELNRINFINTNNSYEMYKVFRDVYKINSMEEKIIYLLCVYVENCDEDMMIILNDTGLLADEVVCSVIENGIKENEIISSVLKEYIINHSSKSLLNIIENMNKQVLCEKEEYNKKDKTYVDYNINHLESSNIKDAEDRNNNLKRKIRRKILY